jgi:hypothetical protein
LEVNEVILKGHSIFSLQITAVEVGLSVVRQYGTSASSSRRITSRTGTRELKVPVCKVGARTQLEADSTLAEIGEKIGAMQRNLRDVGQWDFQWHQ